MDHPTISRQHAALQFNGQSAQLLVYGFGFALIVRCV
jgi:hypothetical protein